MQAEMECGAWLQRGARCGSWLDVRLFGDVPLCRLHHRRAQAHAEQYVAECRRNLAVPPVLTPDQWNELAVVYYLRRQDELIKIGVSARLRNRLLALRKEHGPLELLAQHRGARDAERAMHKRFADDRVEGEWFLPSDELLAHIEHVRNRTEKRGAAA